MITAPTVLVGSYAEFVGAGVPDGPLPTRPYKEAALGGTMWASSPTRGTKKLVILHKNGFWVLDKLPKGCYNFGNFIDKSYDEDGNSKSVSQRAGDGGSLANCG